MVQENKFKRGFTIVELLIVIVVIGILAAITIVSYAGITGRANTTKAQTNAAAIQKVIEAFNADCSRYPATLAETTQAGKPACFTSSIYPAGITITSATTALSSANGLTNVTYECLGASCSATANAGGRIKYFDFTTGAASTTVIYLGTAVSGSTYTNPV